MKYILSLIFLLFVTTHTVAQQSFEIPHNYSNQFLNNPAATGVWEKLDISAFYSKTFTNVDKAPTILFGAVQYALPKQNAAFGVSINSETASLLSNTSVLGTFAYKLKGIANRNDFISLGIGLRVSSINFSGSDAIVSQLGEPNLGGDESGFGINFSAGAFYSSSSAEIEYRGSDDFIYQGGLSVSKIGQKTNFQNVNSFVDEYVINGFVSTIFAQHADFVVQSYAEAIYGSNSSLNVIGGVRTTLNNTVIIGGSLDANLALGIEFGFSLKSTNKSNVSSAIINFNIPFNDIAEYVNPGVGLSLRHLIDLSTGW